MALGLRLLRLFLLRIHQEVAKAESFISLRLTYKVETLLLPRLSHETTQELREEIIDHMTLATRSLVHTASTILATLHNSGKPVDT